MEMNQSQENTLRRHGARITGLGFGVVITLMLVLAVTTLTRLGRIHEIREISQDHTSQVQLAQRMYDASRERAFLLFRIVYEEDLFLADELAMRFRELSLVFGQARQTLLKQHLAPEVLQLLEKQRQAAEDTMLQQDLVLGLVFAGNRGKSQETFTKYALPSQEGVLGSVDQLIKMQLQSMELASKQASEHERMLYLFLLIGTVVVTLLGGGVAYSVQRNMSGFLHSLSEKS
jgi:hypothetical protein